MLEVTFDESYKDSRKIKYDKENITQTIVAFMCGNFLEEAEVGPTGLYQDDILVMQAAYSFLPISYEVPVPAGYNLTLTIADLELEQVNNNTWKITATYDIPQNGGQSGGGAGTSNIGNVGPDAGENDGEGWSENYTQISVNLSATSRNRKFSLATVACQRSDLIPAGGVPYPPGKAAPIGHTEDGVEGADVYEREFSFNITSYFPPEKLKYAYIRKLARMQTTRNTQRFFGFNVGEVLFLEADLSGDTFQVVPVTFSFRQRNNFFFSKTLPTALANPDLEDSVDRYFEPDFADTTIISGWDLVDYRYAPIPDNGAKMVLQRPVLRTIHRIYDYSDFSAFEL